MNTQPLADILGGRRFPLMCGLAGGGLAAAVTAFSSFTSPIDWSPPSNSAGGWFGSPQLDAMNDAVNHTIDVAHWLIDGAFNAAASFVTGALAWGLAAFALVLMVRFTRWFQANFRLA